MKPRVVRHCAPNNASEMETKLALGNLPIALIRFFQLRCVLPNVEEEQQ
jgi:hypothetical protein